MRKKIKRDPEFEAYWTEQRRRMQERIDYHEGKIRERQEREDRRRRRMRRLTFGLLPR
jgi:hypothetical protein